MSAGLQLQEDDWMTADKEARADGDPSCTGGRFFRCAPLTLNHPLPSYELQRSSRCCSPRATHSAVDVTRPRVPSEPPGHISPGREPYPKSHIIHAVTGKVGSTTPGLWESRQHRGQWGGVLARRSVAHPVHLWNVTDFSFGEEWGRGQPGGIFYE